MRWDYRDARRAADRLRRDDACGSTSLHDQQAIKAAFQASFVSSTPISFLTGVGRITDDFRPERDPRGCTADRLYVKLLPKQSQDLGALALGVDRGTFDIVEAAVTDPIGNVTTLSFTGLQRNVDIPDAEFQFVPPPGADVIIAPSAAAEVPPSGE